MSDIIRAMHPDTYYTPIGVWVEIISKTEDYLPFENPKFSES